jgi:hypothetical protein
MAKEKLNKVKKPFYKKWWVWVLAVMIISGLADWDSEETATTESEPAPTEQVETTTEETVTEPEVKEEPKEEVKEEPAKEEEPAEPEMSVSQIGAIQKAEGYISMGGFSKTGLIKQLEFEGFSNEEATFATENIDVDWKEQAKIKAQGYVDMGGFNRQSLLEQLKFEGFTSDEATHGVNEVGL